MAPKQKNTQRSGTARPPVGSRKRQASNADQQPVKRTRRSTRNNPQHDNNPDQDDQDNNANWDANDNGNDQHDDDKQHNDDKQQHDDDEQQHNDNDDEQHNDEVQPDEQDDDEVVEPTPARTGKGRVVKKGPPPRYVALHLTR
jgi:hypothetical protein